MSERERIFLRGIGSAQYGLSEFRRAQRGAPRVVHGGWRLSGNVAGYGDHGSESEAVWMLAPGDESFLTQTLQVHTVELAPGGSNRAHGHQNEALFYVLEGSGHEIHDGARYDWSKDDLVIVHVDSMHQHFNASPTEKARLIVFKAKATFNFLGLVQQGRGAPDRADLGPREDWTRVWSADAAGRKKVVKPSDTSWVPMRGGRKRVLASKARTDVRAYSVDLAEVQLDPGAGSARYLHMADEVNYVISGRGETLQWDVEADIADRYYARVAREPLRAEFAAGDLVYVPQNTIHQFTNADPGAPLRLLTAQNRLFSLLGYDATVELADVGTGAPVRAGSAAR
jgi:quercetin dioxygenase-like cupin family protein